MVESILNTDHEETVGLKKGDRAAFNQIFNRYQSKLMVYTRAIVKSEDIAQDIVQETFIRLWVKRHDLDPDQQLSGYLHTIARNLAFNHLKRAGYDQELKQKIWEKIQESEQRVELEEVIFGKESHELLQKAINQLPPKRQQIFKLSREKGLSHREIAEQLGISQNTVKNQIVSALHELREFLEKYRDVAFCWLIVLFLT